MSSTRSSRFLTCLLLAVITPLCAQAQQEAQPKVASITQNVWQEAVVSVTDIDRTARFFIEIGGYESKFRGPLDSSEIAAWGLPAGATGEALLLGPAGQNSIRDGGLIRLIRFDNAGKKEPTRPGSRAWDTGCFFSLMVRMKDMASVYDDAIAMGWWTETPITYLEFGDSKLNVMVFQGPDGVQVQSYERLAPPLPPGIPEFERFTRPFNIMQMVRDRDVAYDFFTQVLGFDTFAKTEPYVDEKPAFMPLGIPKNLTTSVPYRAGIVYPVAGEFGRMEMIEIDGLDGHDYADRCHAPNLGILAVRYPVDDAVAASALVQQRGASLDVPLQTVTVQPYGELQLFSVKAPDGANVQFYNILKESNVKESQLMETIQMRTVAIVTFPVSQATDAESMRQLLEKAGPAYTNIPGLLRKYFLFKEGVGGGIYEWATRGQAEAFYTREWYDRIRQQAGAEPEVQFFDAPAIADGIQHKLDIFLP